MNHIESKKAAAGNATPWRLLDCERPNATVDTWESLKKSLLGITETSGTPNRIVDLESPQGDTLSIGIAGPRDRNNPTLTEPLACLNFTNSSRNPPYLTIVGDPGLTYENGGVVVFQVDGTWTEILHRNCVPVDVMLQIVKHFYATGSLPESIRWEEV